jgi:prophage tail gpP-like protein
MSITLSVAGVPYTSFKQIEVSKSLDNMVGVFSFRAVDPKGFRFPFKVGDSCTVRVDGEAVIEGYIDKIHGAFSAESHEITISGRDKTSDVVDSTIGGNITFKPPISLKSVIEQTLQKSGITGLKVVDNVPGLAPFKAEDFVASKVGKKVFKFLEQYARKRQVLLTTNDLGEIIITRSPTAVENQYIINQFNGNANNVIEAKFTYDNSSRFHKYQMWSQLSPMSLVDNFDAQRANRPDPSGTAPPAKDTSVQATQIATVKNEATDSQIRNTRTYNKIAEQPTQQTTLADRAKWEGNIRRARSFTYNPSIQGFRYDRGSKLWALNTLVHVRDEFANLNATMLINEVTYMLSADRGSITKLSLVDKDSYKLKLEFSKSSKKSQKLAPDLVGDFDAKRANEPDKPGTV